MKQLPAAIQANMAEYTARRIIRLVMENSGRWN
jgi:hypothetical protein